MSRNRTRDARRARQLSTLAQAVSDARIKPEQRETPLVTRLLQALHRATYYISL